MGNLPLVQNVCSTSLYTIILSGEQSKVVSAVDAHLHETMQPNKAAATNERRASRRIVAAPLARLKPRSHPIIRVNYQPASILIDSQANACTPNRVIVNLATRRIRNTRTSTSTRVSFSPATANHSARPRRPPRRMSTAGADCPL